MLGGEHTVISQAADLIDDPIVMYKTTHHIKGRYYDTSQLLIKFTTRLITNNSYQ